MDNFEQARILRCLPAVLDHDEVCRLLGELQGGYDIRTVQELMGHENVTTKMIYTHVLNKGGKGVNSPLDHLN